MALFLHKPLFLNSPDSPELAATVIRYVPMPARSRLVEMLGTVDLRLVASGHVHQSRDVTLGHTRHVWSPSTAFFIPDHRQEVIGIKEVGLDTISSQTASRSVTSGHSARSTSIWMRCSGARCPARAGPIAPWRY